MAIHASDFVDEPEEEWTPLVPTLNPPFADYDATATFLTPEMFAARWNRTARMHAASEKDGFRLMSREQALQRKFVQANARSAANLIICDVDSSDARDEVEELVYTGQLPLFSFMVLNPENGHAHVGWFVEGEARKKKQQEALRLLRNGFGRNVEPEPEAYAFYGMRNPLWASAVVVWGTSYRYPFSELFSYMPEEAVKVERDAVAAARSRYGEEHPLNPDSGSRFRDLWKECSGFLYGKQGRDDFEEWAVEYCLHRNNEFWEPLPEREVRSMAKNITRFIMNRMDSPSTHSGAAKRKKLLTTEAFAAEQRAASIRRPVVAEAAARHQQVLALVERGYTNKQVRQHFHVKPGTARVWVLRAKKWAEKQQEAA